MLRVMATSATRCVRLLPMRRMALRPLCTASGDNSASPDESSTVVASSSKTKAEPRPWEFMPHFSHAREKTLAEVADEYERTRPDRDDKSVPYMRPYTVGDMSKPRGFTVTGEEPPIKETNPNSPYPLAKTAVPRNERAQTEYGYQRSLYHQQLRLLRRKWMMEHIMAKERKAKLRNLKAERSTAKATGPRDPDSPLSDRQLEVRERHEKRMSMRKQAQMEKQQRNAAYLKERETEMTNVRSEAIEALTRMSNNFITAENIDERMPFLLSIDENYDLDVEIPKRKGFDPNAERADQILRRLKGAR